MCFFILVSFNYINTSKWERKTGGKEMCFFKHPICLLVSFNYINTSKWQSGGKEMCFFAQFVY